MNDFFLCRKTHTHNNFKFWLEWKTPFSKAIWEYALSKASDFRPLYFIMHSTAYIFSWCLYHRYITEYTYSPGEKRGPEKKTSHWFKRSPSPSSGIVYPNKQRQQGACIDEQGSHWTQIQKESIEKVEGGERKFYLANFIDYHNEFVGFLNEGWEWMLLILTIARLLTLSHILGQTDEVWTTWMKRCIENWLNRQMQSCD